MEAGHLLAVVILHELRLALGRVCHLVDQAHQHLDWPLAAYCVLRLLQIGLEAFQVMLLNVINAHLVKVGDGFVDGSLSFALVLLEHWLVIEMDAPVAEVR